MFRRSASVFALCLTAGVLLVAAPASADRPTSTTLFGINSPTVSGVFGNFKRQRAEEIVVEDVSGSTVRANALPPEPKVVLWSRRGLKAPDGSKRLPSVIHARLSTRSDDAVRVRQSHRKAILDTYGKRGFEPIWVGDYGLSKRARRLLETLATADEDGLNKSNYLPQSLLSFSDDADELKSSPSLLGKLELELTVAALAYAHDISAGAVDPFRISEIHTLDVIEVKPGDAVAALARSVRPDVYLTSLQSTIPQYGLLKKKLAEFRKLEQSRATIDIEPGPAIRPGDTDSRLGLVRARLRSLGRLETEEATDTQSTDPQSTLAGEETTVVSSQPTNNTGSSENLKVSVTGELVSATDAVTVVSEPTTVAAVSDPSYYDPSLVEAVRGLQKQAGLKVDGIIGNNTLQALNGQSVTGQVKKVLLNMERLRWLPKALPVKHVFVNQAFFETWLIDGQDIVFRSDVIVGKPRFQTAVFSDEMESVVINPNWNVPRSIAVNEMLPKLQVDPLFLERQGYHLLGAKGRISDWSSVNWEGYTQETLPYDIRQPPGPSNALGRVKFLFPNKHAIYMHDTPARSLFKNKVRAYSHGCVRVASPVEFARVILGNEGWAPHEVEQAIESGQRQEVFLKQKVPVHLGYYTAWAKADGSVDFRNDIYGRDRVLDQAFEQNKGTGYGDELSLN